MSVRFSHAGATAGQPRPVPRMAEPPTATILHQFLRTRRSIRNYLPEPVPAALVESLIAVAQQAPSAHNRQPWRWAVLAERDARERLAHAMGEAWARDLRADGVPGERIEQLLARSHQRIVGAPMAVLPCLSMAEMDSYPDEARQLREWQMAVQSVALACQTLMLAAHAVGLGSCWICAPIFCTGVVRESLALPQEWEPQGLITLGWPTDDGRDRPRHPTDETVLWR